MHLATIHSRCDARLPETKNVLASWHRCPTSFLGVYFMTKTKNQRFFSMIFVNKNNSIKNVLKT